MDVTGAQRCRISKCSEGKSSENPVSEKLPFKRRRSLSPIGDDQLNGREHIEYPNTSTNSPKLKKHLSFSECGVEIRRIIASWESSKPVVKCGDLNVAHKEIGQYKVLKLINKIINDSGFLIQISPITSRINGMPASLSPSMSEARKMQFLSIKIMVICVHCVENKK